MTSSHWTQGAGGGAERKTAQSRRSTKRVDAREPAPSQPLFPSSGHLHPLLRQRKGSPSPVGPASLPSAPEVLCGCCCRAAGRRVGLLGAGRSSPPPPPPISFSSPPVSSSPRCPTSAAARRTPPSAARGAEPPDQGRVLFAGVRLPVPVGRRTGFWCRFFLILW